jgi:hypothetical protein
MEIFCFMFLASYARNSCVTHWSSVPATNCGSSQGFYKIGPLCRETIRAAIELEQHPEAEIFSFSSMKNI